MNKLHDDLNQLEALSRSAEQLPDSSSEDLAARFFLPSILWQLDEKGGAA